MVKLIAFRVLFTIMIYYYFNIDQMDIKIVVVYRIIDQLVYI